MIFKLACANVRRSYKDFAIYFFTLLVGVAVYYAFNSIEAQQAVLRLSEQSAKMLDMLGMLIDMVSVFITVILAFLVVYASRFLIRRRNKEFGLYLLLGMPRTKLLALTCVETLIVGAVSLVVGLALGVALSQALVWLTALLFEADMSGQFTFLFAPDVALRTVAVFMVIFAVSLVINVGYLMRAKLIDLINADRKNEVLTLRSIPLAFVLFLVSCGLLAAAYALLLKNGLLAFNAEFAASTALMVVGTLLFFYSLSGFLLRVVQSIKPLYYRGLNMFALRQVASRINSSFASMTVICVTLFLAITSVCGGIGIVAAMQGSFDKQTAYDASMRTYLNMDSYYGDGEADGAPEPAKEDSPGWRVVDEHRLDAAAGMHESTATVGTTPWDDVVGESVEVDLYSSDVTYDDLEVLLGNKLADYTTLVEEDYEQQRLSAVKLSQYNQALELAGKDPVSLEPGQALLSCDMDALIGYMQDVADKGGSLEVFGHELELADWLATDCIETTATAMNTGMLVVPDEVIDSSPDAVVWCSILDVRFADGVDAADWDAMMDGVSEQYGEADVWPCSMYQSRQEIFDQNVGLTAVIGYLAVYIGFVLVVACAAILAIQQLTAASDNRLRYRLLDKLGASRGMIDGALFKQIVIAFVFPLLLAVCHSACALTVVMEVVEMFGHVDIAVPAAITAAGFGAVYCLYFVLTYFQARGVIHSEK